MFNKSSWFSSMTSDEKTNKMTQINETYQFLEKLITNEKFEQYSYQLKKQINNLMESLKKLLEKIDKAEKKSTADISKCRELINDIFKNFLAVTYNEKDIIPQAQTINTFFFANSELSIEQKEHSVYTILTGENERTAEEKNRKLQMDIKKERAEIIRLANLILNKTQEEFGSEMDIFEKMITYLSNNNEGQASEVLLSLWKTYKTEFEKNLTESNYYEKISNYQKLILDYLKKLSPENSIYYVSENDIEHWYTDYWDLSKDALVYHPEVINRHEKTIEICALGWTDLLTKDETQALKLLKSMMTALCQPKKSIKHHNHPFKDFDSLAFFLLKISELSQNQKLKIQTIAIKTMGYKIYDLIAAHFKWESKFQHLDRHNCIVFSIIQTLLANTTLKKYLISSIQPVIDVLSQQKVTVTKGCHLSLASSTERPTLQNLSLFELKIMSSIPKYEQFAEDTPPKKNIIVLLQPDIGKLPSAIYLVDRRDKIPVITELSFTPKQNMLKLVEALFPSVNDYNYFDLDLLHGNLIDELSEKTNLFQRFPMLIKRKGKNSYYMYTPQGQLYKFGTGNTTLLNYLKDLNSSSCFSNSEKIWVSPEHHPTLYQAVIPLENHESYLQEFNYDGDVNSLKEAFVKSFNLLFTIQNYPPELIRILYEYLQINNDDLLNYFVKEFINPVFKMLSKENSNLKFWSEKIISVAMEALTADEEKKLFYQKRIAKPVLDLIHSETLETYLAQFCVSLAEVHVPELEFNIMFINPYLQLVEDAGLSNQIKNIDLSLPYETQIKHFPEKLNRLKKLLDEGKIAQKNKEESLHQLENLENDFLILCYCYKEKFVREPTVGELTLPMDDKMKEATRDFYNSLLLSTFSKLKDREIENAQFCFELIKERKEYTQFRTSTVEEQLLIFSQKISKKIWDKKIYEISEDTQISPVSKVADTHFERLDFLEKSFEHFNKDRMGTFIEISLDDNETNDKKYHSKSFIINKNNMFSHSQLNSYIQRQISEKSTLTCTTT